MTMHELEALLQQHYPSAPPPCTQQGRAGVTKHVGRNARYDNLESFSALRTAAPAQAFWWNYQHKRICLECGKEFDRHGSRQKYCSDACKQKAYRKRLKVKAK